MIKPITLAALLCLPLLHGCGSPPQAPLQESADAAVKKQALDAPLAVRQFVDAHGAVMAGIGELKSSSQKTQSDLESLKGTSQKTLETAQRSLQILEDISKRQGTGEITVFFPAGSANLAKGSLEHDRLVRFADFLAHESRGRKIILVSIGSASALGSQKGNLTLAKKRSEVPLDVLDKYLINVPHEFHQVVSTGDALSPKGVKLKEHQRYQHTRVIAVFDKDQVPAIPATGKV